MVDYRVSILAAGAGQRFGDRSKFGHKALFRVGDKAVISHIIDLFSEDTEFVIALGYNGHLVKQYLEMFHPNQRFIYVSSDNYGAGYGPGYSLELCRDHLRSPFYSFACDTIIDGFRHDETSNWIGYAPITQDDARQYCTVKINTQDSSVEAYFDKRPDGTTEAWTGVAFIKDHDEFWEAMKSNRHLVNQEIQIFPPLFSLPELKGRPLPGWYDTGREEGLRAARRNFAGLDNLDKDDEEIYKGNGNVVKYFFDADMVSRRLKRAKALGGIVPIIERYTDNFYRYKSIEGADLSRVNEADGLFTGMLEFSRTHLWKDVRLSSSEEVTFRSACRKFYHEKTLSRTLASRVADQSYVINGKRVPPLEVLFEDVIDWPRLSDGVPSAFHGDFNMTNIIYTRDKSFRFIDWRQDFGGVIEYGDRYYDFAKLYHGLIWPHVSVRQSEFVVDRKGDEEVSVDIVVPSAIETCRVLFETWLQRQGYDQQKVRVLAALVLLNIAPLHEASLDEHLSFWGGTNYASSWVSSENIPCWQECLYSFFGFHERGPNDLPVHTATTTPSARTEWRVSSPVLGNARSSLKPGIFMDRDNTLIVDRGYTHLVEDFAWMPGAPEALRRFHKADLPIFVVTNQGGLALGLFNEEDLHRYHSHLRDEASKIGSKILDIAFCPHHPAAMSIASHDLCGCRKPNPGMILQLAKKWGITLEASVMIGDRQSDVDAGVRAGCHSYLFDGGNLDQLAREVLARHF